MTRPRRPGSTAASPSNPPGGGAEGNVASFLTPRLRQLTFHVEAALPRLRDEADAEAVHDFRVALRRLRSLLRPARLVYGDFHTRAVSVALAHIADETGKLRDEEVLVDTISELRLPPAMSRETLDWLLAREPHRLALQRHLTGVVNAGTVDAAVLLLEALLMLPVMPRRDRPLSEFAAAVVEDAKRGVLQKVNAETHDGDQLHDLRIRYKRLRYAVDAFEQVLPVSVRPLSALAAAYQKALGEIHDVDVAAETVRRTRTLRPVARTATLAALSARRTKMVARYLAVTPDHGSELPGEKNRPIPPRK